MLASLLNALVWLLLVVLVRALRGVYTEHNVVRVRVCAMFWHFVDVVWVVIFSIVYLIR